jgi:hypothetical protein
MFEVRENQEIIGPDPHRGNASHECQSGQNSEVLTSTLGFFDTSESREFLTRGSEFEVFLRRYTRPRIRVTCESTRAILCSGAVTLLRFAGVRCTNVAG